MCLIIIYIYIKFIFLFIIIFQKITKLMPINANNNILIKKCNINYLTRYLYNISFDPNSGSTGTNIIKR